jgi:hypothetical protein
MYCSRRKRPTSQMECGVWSTEKCTGGIGTYSMTRHHFQSSVISFDSIVITFKGPLNVLTLKSNVVTDIIGH